MMYLLFAAGIMIELLGMTISVIGVGQLVGMNFIIILLALAFDIGKITTVSSLQRNWSKLNWAMRGYGIVAIIITMLITSFGAASYLTTSMQSGISTVEKIQTQLDLLDSENVRLIARKKQIDDQIAAIPIEASTRQRTLIIANFQVEQEAVTKRIAEITNKQSELQLEKIQSGGKASGIVSLSKSLGVQTEFLIRFLVGLIIFIFDPFAIYLIMSANWMYNSKSKVNVSEIECKRKEMPASDFANVPDDQVTPQEEIIESEVAPVDTVLTHKPVPSILDTVDAASDLFSTEPIPAQVLTQYRRNNNSTPKGINL